MDINELNKMSLIAQFNKLTSQTNFMGAEDVSFAGLLEKNVADVSFSASEGKNVSKQDVPSKHTNDDKEEKISSSNNKEKIEKKERPEDKKESQKTEREDKSVKEDGAPEVEDEVKKEKEDTSSENVNAFAVNPFAQEAENVAPVDTDAFSEVENIEAVSSELLNDILSGKVQVINEQGEVLPLTELSYENLSKQNSLQIINPETGEKVQLTGFQLAQEMLSFEQKTFAEELVPQMDSELASAQSVQSAQIGKLGMKTMDQTMAEAVENADVFEEIGDEGVSVEELPVEKSVKVEVSVKEEDFSFRDKQSLLKDSISLQAVEEDVDASNITTSTASAMPKTTSNNTANMAVVQQNMVQMADDNKATTQNIAVAEAKQISSVNAGSQTVMSGAEFVASARAEQAGKNNQTSLNDVYKGMSKEVVEQVKVNITKSAVKGVDTIEVRLKPEELGHIEIKMQIKNGKLQAHIISSRPETMEALQRDAQVLEQAFNDAGFQTDSNSLSFSFRNEGNQAQEQNNQLRSFIGKVFEQEANIDEAMTEIANQNWSAENGLNIRV